MATRKARVHPCPPLCVTIRPFDSIDFDSCVVSSEAKAMHIGVVLDQIINVKISFYV